MGGLLRGFPAQKAQPASTQEAIVPVMKWHQPCMHATLIAHVPWCGGQLRDGFARQHSG